MWGGMKDHYVSLTEKQHWQEEGREEIPNQKQNYRVLRLRQHIRDYSLA